MLEEYSVVILVASTIITSGCAVAIALLARLASILHRPRPEPKKIAQQKAATKPTHLLIVLGSGGHTAEMFNMLSSIEDVVQNFTFRTYVVSSGDNFSAQKALEFEQGMSTALGEGKEGSKSSYSIVTARRARYVHQSFLTTPFTAILSLWDCIRILQADGDDKGILPKRSSPDLILTNGPGTGVCIVLASIILLFVGQCKQEQMRSIFIESWARVKTLSLSGKILKGLVSRVLVQWPQLAEDGLEYIGPLVS